MWTKGPNFVGLTNPTKLLDADDGEPSYKANTVCGWFDPTPTKVAP